jgi:hypothetical protein
VSPHGNQETAKGFTALGGFFYARWMNVGAGQLNHEVHEEEADRARVFAQE